MPSTATALAADPMPLADRRGATRFRIAYRVQIRCGAETAVAHSVDVSATGMFLETRQPLPVGSAIHLSFSAAGAAGAREPVEVEGQIVRRVAPAEAASRGQLPGVAVSFTRFLWGGDAYARELANRLGSGQPHPLASRRRSPRISVGIPVYWGHEGRTREAGYLTNLSAGGAFFLEGSATVPVNASINLWFEVPVDGNLRPVRAVARVERVTGGGPQGLTGMAVTLQTSPLDQATLQAFLDRHRDGVRLEKRSESIHPTRLDELFLAASADWEARGDAAVGAKVTSIRRAPAPAPASPTPAVRATSGGAGSRPTQWLRSAALALKVASIAAAAAVVMLTGYLLRLF